MSETLLPDRQLRQVRSRTAGFQTREKNGGPVIEGFFAVFNSDYECCPGGVEQVAPCAFDNTLDRDIRALCDHETRLVLGRTAAGTLHLELREEGLWGSIAINEHDVDAMNLYARVQRGDVTQCSFGFDILAEEESRRADGTWCWTLTDVLLWEVSVVTFPAYAETSAQARRRDLENIRARALAVRKNELKERIQKWH